MTCRRGQYRGRYILHVWNKILISKKQQSFVVVSRCEAHKTISCLEKRNREWNIFARRLYITVGDNAGRPHGLQKVDDTNSFIPLRAKLAGSYACLQSVLEVNVSFVLGQYRSFAHTNKIVWTHNAARGDWVALKKTHRVRVFTNSVFFPKL